MGGVYEQWTVFLQSLNSSTPETGIGSAGERDQI